MVDPTEWKAVRFPYSEQERSFTRKLTHFTDRTSKNGGGLPPVRLFPKPASTTKGRQYRRGLFLLFWKGAGEVGGWFLPIFSYLADGFRRIKA